MTRTARSIVAIPLALACVMLSLPGDASAQTQLFQVEKSDATKLLQVQDDAGLVARGAFDAGAIPAQGAGVRLMWYPRKAAFRAGRVTAAQWDDASVGQWSVAFGENTTASGTHSVAMNGGTTASADRSVAMGGGTTASGDFAVAMGQTSVASGVGSTAMGVGTTAGGPASTAMGRDSKANGESSLAAGYATEATGNFSLTAGFGTKATAERTAAFGDNTVASATWALAGGLASVASGATSTAIGDHVNAAGTASVALGTSVTAQGNGSFIFGDRSTGFNVAAAENTFMVRAFGGLGFNTGVNIGCDLPAGSGTWSCTSSRLAKEAFEEVDGEEILTKLAGIPIQRWRYLGNSADHLGPFAEDFRAAFGLGESSTKIASVDADGIALRAIQALERRTDELREENAQLRQRLDRLEGRNDR